MWCRHLDARDCTLYCAARCCYRWQPPSREKTKLISVFAAHQPGNDEHRTEGKKKGNGRRLGWICFHLAPADLFEGAQCFVQDLAVKTCTNPRQLSAIYSYSVALSSLVELSPA